MIECLQLFFNSSILKHKLTKSLAKNISATSKLGFNIPIFSKNMAANIQLYNNHDFIPNLNKLNLHVINYHKNYTINSNFLNSPSSQL